MGIDSGILVYRYGPAIFSDFDDLQSRLQCLEMEHMITSQSNKTLAEKLQQQEEKMKVLEKCKQEMLTLDNRSKELCTCIQGLLVAVNILIQYMYHEF